MKRKLLVLGATGFIGRNMAEYFAAKNEFEVIGTYFKSAPLNHPNIKMVKADLTRADLRITDFRGANLKSANLAGANMMGAVITIDQVLEAASLEGTIMPNGIIYPEEVFDVLRAKVIPSEEEEQPQGHE